MKSNQQNTISDPSDEIDIGKLFGLLLDDKLRIILITCMFAVAGVIFALLSTPIYKADALIQVEEKKGGVSSLLSENVGELFTSDSSATTEIEILKSRMILGKTVDSLNLTTKSAPIYLPYFGKGLARLLDENRTIEVSRFELPQRFQPIGSPVGFIVKLINTDTGEYELIDSTGKRLLRGHVGVGAENNGYDIFVRQLTGRKGDEYSVIKTNRLDAIGTVKQGLTIVEKGKQTGVLELSFTGENKTQIEAILNSVSENYLLQNVQRNSAEAEKSLAFLNGHLPDIKSVLTAAEDQLNLYRQANESIDLSLEAQSTLKVMVELEAQLNELTFKESEISQRFTKDHPAYKSLLDKRDVLLNEKKRLNAQVQQLPKTQQQILRLTRDVEVNQQIYVQLLNKVQELNILKAGTVGNVRILDKAQSYTNAVKPRRSLIVVFATLLGCMLAIALTLIKAAFHRGIENPDEIEQLGLPVYASIPDSEDQKMLNVRHKRAGVVKSALLASENPADLAVEALRSLRTSLHFAMMEAKNNIVAISGPAPEIGKSFVTSNFAAVLAQGGQKVLIIDADLRKGHLIRFFGVGSEQGLSDVLSDQVGITDVIQTTNVENLDVIVRGLVPPNPSELLMNARFEALLNHVSKQYDIILIDTPPVLAVTDPSIIGRHAGTMLMVGRFGKNSIKEIEVARNRFLQSGVEVKGFILNAVQSRAANAYGYGYGYYNYTYDSEK
ncbi:MAG: polysaccharide biosynthesis tyrosine autokinase [Parashewanella sp.]